MFSLCYPLLNSQGMLSLQRTFLGKPMWAAIIFNPVELKQLALETRSFTRDGFTNSAADRNPACKGDACYLPDKPYECTDQRGHHGWLNPPIGCITQALQHYSRCKAQEPNTSICILVPYWRRASYWPLLKGIQILRTYPEGSSIFLHKAKDGSIHTLQSSWPAVVFYDPPPWL